MDGRIYDLRVLKFVEFKKRDVNVFLYVYLGFICFILKEFGVMGENERKFEDRLLKYVIYLFIV